jgi:hypothetical protein
MLDFTNPTALKEVAYYKFSGIFGSDNWSALSVHRPSLQRGRGSRSTPRRAWREPNSARGTVVFRADLKKPGKSGQVDHLNPQTID